MMKRTYVCNTLKLNCFKEQRACDVSQSYRAVYSYFVRTVIDNIKNTFVIVEKQLNYRTNVVQENIC